MSARTMVGSEPLERREVEPRNVVRRRVRAGQFGVGLAGVVAMLVSAWGGIIPYVGPIFGYSGDGSGSWYWNLAHALLALVPGAVGVVLGLFVIGESRGIALGRGRLSLATAGTLLMITGAWFVIGPLAWPVLSNGGSYFVAGSHLKLLAYELGYSLGTGIILVVCGAFIDGWASRNLPRTGVADEPGAASAAGSVERGSGTVEPGI
jgi:hypothetical protein